MLGRVGGDTGVAIRRKNKLAEDGRTDATIRGLLPAGAGNAAPTAPKSNGGRAAASATNEENAVPMLDVHAPHDAVRTWKDFFIHIAAIAVGLLIAIGLEQTVEYFHHRHQVAELREALRVEREQNHLRVAEQTVEFRVRVQVIQTNLAVFHYLRLHPGTGEKDLPGKVNWHNIGSPFIDYVWQTAQQTGVTAFMPPGEVRHNAELYRRLRTCTESYAAFRVANTEARAYTVDDADLSHLTPVQIEEQVRLTRTVLNRLYRYGADLRNLSISNPDFVPAPSMEEIGNIVHESAEERRDMEDNAKRLQRMDDLPESFPSDEKR
jgi:hypothetical protein